MILQHVFSAAIFSIFFAACSADLNGPDAAIFRPTPAAKVKYLALGDSYTIGQSVPADERWPVELQNRLQARGIAFDSMKIIAKTGWTTANLNAGIDAALPLEGYNLVSLLIGVNNEYQYRSIEEYADQFRALLERSILLAGNKPEKVFVVSIPDYGYTPYGQSNQTVISGRIDAFNAVNAAITNEMGIRYFDITPASRQSVPGFVANDGLHPSGLQYSAWVDVMEEGVFEMLQP